MRHRSGPIVVAVCVAGLLAGCAQTVDGRVEGTPAPRSSGRAASQPSTGPTGFPSTGPASTSVPVAPSTSVVPSTSAAPVPWQTVKDSRTGISFPMPGKPKIETSASVADDGTRLRNTTYTYLDPVTNSGIIVGVTTGATERIRANRDKFGAIGTSLVRRLKAEGSTDAVVIEKMRRTVHGRAALSYRFRYTPTDPAQGQPSWRVCEIDAGSAIVSTQVIDFPLPGGEAQSLTRSQAVENRLLAGLAFG